MLVSSFSMQLAKEILHINFVMHIFDKFCDSYISLFIVDHLQLKFGIFLYLRIVEERNVKVVCDLRESR